MSPRCMPSQAPLYLGIFLSLFLTLAYLSNVDFVTGVSPPLSEPQYQPTSLHRKHRVQSYGVFWDVHSAVYALMLRFNRNQYACELQYSLGGASSGDGVWPVCLDGWIQIFYSSPPFQPPWLSFKPKPKLGRRNRVESSPEVSTDGIVERTLPRTHMSRRTGTQDTYFRPGTVLQELDKTNTGLPRPAEPMWRPPEGRHNWFRLTPWFGMASSQKELGNDPPCVVYVFGVDWDFSWEDELHDMTGCETHSFDPSLEMESHYRGRNQWVWNRGISPISQNTTGTGLTSGKTATWQLLTLADHMARLGHKHIDLLKVDVEGYEWDTFARAFEDRVMERVEQVLIEVHMFESSLRKWKPASSPETPLTSPGDDQVSDAVAKTEGILGWIEILDLFEKNGFVQYYHHTNPMSSLVSFGDDIDINRLPCCFELAFVRKR
ncbi:hypothetical protein M427DRAFT_155794 [Gonapodya prolifera JEL478]|uniref:Methyltransferase domain-containing protein n=1 Tax=Gonapodya prolifera (strain JEL478) TaxID=1344416 RepID=A0A139AD60_GONPJ|nr:hypothetical protein M427DRAFT_155794 [Gonapodya prolifera JEL478]|eukprot:KXS14688.1 hypothetical protein M427DRAFT_155794 [Gonapodya prolifera JEL478]